MTSIRKSLAIFTIGIFFSFNLFGQDASELSERANFLLQNSRYEEALIMLDKAIEASPNDPELHYKKAATYNSLMRFDQAIVELKRCTKLDNKYFLAYEMLGDLYSMKMNAQDATENYQKAFVNDADKDRKYTYKLKILDILDKMNRHRFSIKHIEDAKAIVGSTFDLSYYEAMYRNEMGQYDKAEDLMKSIIGDIKVTPGNEEYFYQLIYALHHNGRYNETKEWLAKFTTKESASKFYEFTERYYFSLANTYFKVMDYEKSEENINICLGINPQFVQAFDLQKQLAAINTNKTAVIEAQKRALKAETDLGKKADKLYELANLYFQAKEYGESYIYLEEYQNILPQNQRDLKAIFMKSMCEKETELGNSTDQLSKLALNPQLPAQTRAKFSFAVGLIYKQQGMLDQADEYMKNAYAGPYRDAVRFEFKDIQRLKDEKELDQMAQASKE